tara:strand:- start:708 stop:815 length:108 start_codon:yes stop_codon:yes gene_type:complete
MKRALVGTKHYLIRLIKEYGKDAKVVDVIERELQK